VLVNVVVDLNNDEDDDWKVVAAVVQQHQWGA